MWWLQQKPSRLFTVCSPTLFAHPRYRVPCFEFVVMAWSRVPCSASYGQCPNSPKLLERGAPGVSGVVCRRSARGDPLQSRSVKSRGFRALPGCLHDGFFPLQAIDGCTEAFLSPPRQAVNRAGATVGALSPFLSGRSLSVLRRLEPPEL